MISKHKKYFLLIIKKNIKIEKLNILYEEELYYIMKISKKICIVSTIIPPRFSGAGLQAYRYALRLYKKDKLSFILTEKYKSIGKDKCIFNRFEELPSNKIITVPKEVYKNKKRSQNKIKYFIPFIMWQINLLCSIFWTMFQKRNSFKIVHCVGASSWLSLYSVLIGKFFGKKTVLEMSQLGGDDPLSIRKSSNILIKNFRSFLFSISDIVKSISPALSKAYKSSGMPIEKLREVPIPVDINTFHPLKVNEKMNLRKKLGFKKDITIILYVGDIVKRKAIDLLIKSFAEYINKYSNTILVLVGPTSDSKENLQFYNKMKKLANDLNIEKYIIFTGKKNNVDEYMKISDLFMLLSKREGLPNVLLEAMSTGLPVITLNMPGITEYIFKNRIDGIILNEKNPGKIALEIEALLNNYDLCESISINARKTVENRFSTEIIDQQYQQIYNELIN